MFGSDPGPSRAAYYTAVALFLAILAFAVLGLVRSTSLAGAGLGEKESAPRPAPTRTPRADAPVPTAQIPPPTPSAPTRPPSVTYLYPPPEAPVTASPEPGAQPRR
jgi:hypothetical protein